MARTIGAFARGIAAAFALGLAVAPSESAAAQTQSERFWLAGRYDRNRVIVYFDAVKFGPYNDTVLPNMPAPVARGFFSPAKLSAQFIANYDTASHAERFALGQSYDLLLDNGGVARVTLTTLLGTINDEQVGNDSYVGALATLNDADLGRFTRAYYVLLRHDPAAPRTSPTVSPVRDDTARIGAPGLSTLLHDALSRDTSAEMKAALALAPLVVDGEQSFRIARDVPRTYITAKLKSDSVCTRVSGWVAPLPTPRLLAMETGACRFDMREDDPPLLDVVELSPGRMGLVVLLEGEDGFELRLVEYRDGQSLAQMRGLQSLRAGE